jgi:hypothetical protein
MQESAKLRRQENRTFAGARVAEDFAGTLQIHELCRPVAQQHIDAVAVIGQRFIDDDLISGVAYSSGSGTLDSSSGIASVYHNSI